MDLKIVVGKNIKQYRLLKEWSQEELSFNADLHRTYISSLERGRRNPTVTVLEKIAKALGIPASRLLDN